MIIHGDCLIEMAKMEANSIDFIVTDPPYGLHFMGKHWDHGVPSKEFWERALRICKPGTWIAAFGGTRTHHRLMCAIEDAGWQIRDCMMWLYGSGFPKSHNKLGLEGYGTALKPAWEPIILAMKPIDGTFAQNTEKWGVAGINIEESRIPSESWSRPSRPNIRGGNYCNSEEEPVPRSNDKGRWPANLILDEEAAQELDRQSGTSKSIQSNRGLLADMRGNNYNSCDKEKIFDSDSIRGHNDSGGASRFFYCAKASSKERNEGLEGMPLKEKPLMGKFKDNPGRETPKSSPTPRQNFHPTVKPLALMKYIIKLLAPPGNPILLDPFAGSGSTLVAAKQLGIQCIGIELEKEYCEIAERRLEGYL